MSTADKAPVIRRFTICHGIHSNQMISHGKGRNNIKILEEFILVWGVWSWENWEGNCLILASED